MTYAEFDEYTTRKFKLVTRVEGAKIGEPVSRFEKTNILSKGISSRETRDTFVSANCIIFNLYPVHAILDTVATPAQLVDAVVVVVVVLAGFRKFGVIKGPCGGRGFQRAEASGDTAARSPTCIHAHRVHAIVVRIHSDNRNSDRGSGCVARDDATGACANAPTCKRKPGESEQFRAVVMIFGWRGCGRV